MTDDRAKRLRNLRNRVGSDRDGSDSEGDTGSSEDEPGDDETAEDVTTTESRSEDDATTTAEDDGSDGPDESGIGQNTPSRSDERATADPSDRTDSGETVEFDEAETVDAPSETSTPDGADRQNVEPALQGAIADTSEMVTSTETMGDEPTVDASVLTMDTDESCRAAIGRDEAVFEQGSALIHSAHDSENTVQMLEFFLNESRYAVEIDRISAIVEMKEITRFPRGPDAIDGVTDLRGEITGILDPTVMLDVDRNELSEDHYIVVLKRDDDKQKLGIRVTDVSQAVTYRESQIDETGSVMDTTADHQHEFIEGIIKKNTDGRTNLVTWLDIDAIIENTE
ncbi:chemotaxis protein CheW [Natrarchaeobius chitinivorans]|uniref:Chemotaxis protein CheW n=1 Tax=Natrarchaeobius chitinivorans TaxID=1679083 RepID=A0A3N6MHU9_NATCH|nr:chemotaxis protein CheW [Natrarchaeobius chitinivorans]RQG93586.1 chemotaxis protein CheW [Natrarchaeobius chitinivorans]